MAFTNLRERAESDLQYTLEGHFALPIELTGPDGIKLNVTGQILSDTIKQNPDTGETIIVNNPVLAIRRKSLSQIPQPGETWFVRIPLDPDPSAELADFVIDSDHAPEGGRSLGFIRLYLRKAEQVPL